MSAVAFLNGKFAVLKTPLITHIIKKHHFPPHRVYWEYVGKNLSIKLTKTLNNALKNEVVRILNGPNVETIFPHLSARFWARMALPMLEFNETIFSSPEVLSKFITAGEELAKITAKLIKNSGYEKADNLVYGLSVLVDHDRWVAEKVRTAGVDYLAQKLSARALETTLSFVQSSMDLAFAWMSAASAALAVVTEYRRENMNYLVWLCGELANKLDAYMETLDMVVDDELYEDLVRLGIVERQR